MGAAPRREAIIGIPRLKLLVGLLGLGAGLFFLTALAVAVLWPAASPEGGLGDQLYGFTWMLIEVAAGVCALLAIRCLRTGKYRPAAHRIAAGIVLGLVVGVQRLLGDIDTILQGSIAPDEYLSWFLTDLLLSAGALPLLAALGIALHLSHKSGKVSPAGMVSATASGRGRP